jgi:hypothetical protein
MLGMKRQTGERRRTMAGGITWFAVLLIVVALMVFVVFAAVGVTLFIILNRRDEG